MASRSFCLHSSRFEVPKTPMYYKRLMPVSSGFRQKTKAELFRASLNSSTCSLNLFVSTVILMGISYEIAGAQKSRERLPEGQSEGQTEGQPEGPSPRASGTPSDVPLGNHTEPSVAPPQDKIRRLESKLSVLNTLE